MTTSACTARPIFLESLLLAIIGLARQPLFVAAAAGQTGIFWGRDRRRGGKTFARRICSGTLGCLKATYTPIMAVLPGKTQLYIFWDLTVFRDEPSGIALEKPVKS